MVMGVGVVYIKMRLVQGDSAVAEVSATTTKVSAATTSQHVALQSVE